MSESVADAAPLLVDEDGAPPEVDEYVREHELAGYGGRNEYLSAEDWAANGYGVDELAPASNGNGRSVPASAGTVEPYAEPPQRSISPGRTKFNSLWNSARRRRRPRRQQ